MPEQNQKRQVAHKVRIKDVLAGRYVKEEGWMPNYIETADKKQISRINLIGVIVSKQVEEGVNYQSILVDDGTGRISVKVFDENNRFDDVDVGDVVLLIGRPREYGSERYILLEILKKIKDEKWIQVRKLELGNEKENNEVKQEQKKEIETEEIVENEDIDSQYDKIIQKIKEFDKGNGADFEEVIKNIDEGEKIIDDLLKKGEIFETSPGKLKVLE